MNFNNKPKFLRLHFPIDFIDYEDGVYDFILPFINQWKQDYTLEFTINLENNSILNWGVRGCKVGGRIDEKVVDSGTYTLFDEDMCIINRIDGYVPDGCVPPYEHGHGDYIELDIDKDGNITNAKPYNELNFKGIIPVKEEK